MNRNRHIAVLLVCVLVGAVAVTGGVWAQKGKVKPKTKVPVNPKNQAKLGTKQMAGEDNAKIGTTYTLGKADPINVTLDSVEYTVEPRSIGTQIFAPKAGQKLMVLHYTLHNCNARPRGLAWSTLEITAVDADNTNWRFVTDVGMEDSLERCNMSLKPAQKTKVYTCVFVPAKGEIPKLMFQSGDKLVLRYDLRGKLKPLPAPVADPADPTGATALEKVPAVMGVLYPFEQFYGQIDSIAFSTAPINNRPPNKGCRYLVINAKAKNQMPSVLGLAWSTFRPKLTDIDGGEVSWSSMTLFPSRDDSLKGSVEKGQEMGFRIIYEIKDNVQIKTLAMTQAGSRSYIYDVSGVK